MYLLNTTDFPFAQYSLFCEFKHSQDNKKCLAYLKKSRFTNPIVIYLNVLMLHSFMIQLVFTYNKVSRDALKDITQRISCKTFTSQVFHGLYSNICPNNDIDFSHCLVSNYAIVQTKLIKNQS